MEKFKLVLPEHLNHYGYLFGGNLLEIRGLAGVFVDDAISSGIHEGVEETGKFEIVGSVHGNWAQDVAQIP